MLMLKPLAGALLATGAFIAPALLATSAFAAESEVLVLGSLGSNDTNYVAGSFRHAFGDGDMDHGFKIRFDADRAGYGFSIGSVDTDGANVRARILGGYGWMLDATSLATIYVGPEYFQKSITPDTVFVPDESTWGLFASLELEANFANGSQAFGDFEYSTTQSQFYGSVYYVYPFGDKVMLGPTGNYIYSETYQREALGLRASYFFTPDIEITATGAWAAQQIQGGEGTDFGYLELMHRLRF